MRLLLNKEREPYSRESPREYDQAFHEHEMALAFTTAIMSELYARFGCNRPVWWAAAEFDVMAEGCSWTPNRRNDG